MADGNAKRKSFGRSASTESTEYSVSMGRSVRKKKPKERWLLTRKTWRYMADAGRKLIPEGVQNRAEDIPKIEAYFQEVCKKEPRFLLWRKNSYPGAMGFRRKHKDRVLKGGSCRKAISADEVDTYRPERPKNLALQSIASSSKFDVRKMKEDFLNKPPTPTDYSNLDLDMEQEESQLVTMLEQYLHLAEQEPTKSNRGDFNYQELVDKLQRHLTLASKSPTTSSYPSYYTEPQQQVHFQGDHVQRSLSETLNRYFGQSTNRHQVISDILTDRKALEKLYFELRRTRGFRGSSRGNTYSPNLPYHHHQRIRTTFPPNVGKKKSSDSSHPPPLIEIESETFEVTYHDWGVQTLPIPEQVLIKVDEEYKKTLAEKEEEERDLRQPRRRSSVDNDDISQSVSDTIKRYLRMARKKSVDTDKADRFKRVNYDRNLRNIKAKGEITKPGDDDGLNKGCQTNDDWILTYRDLKFDEINDISDVESRVSSSRSSIDIGIEDGVKSSPSSPPPNTKSHSFLSQLLHGSKHDKHEKTVSSSAATTAAGGGGGAMQKSKSSSSVMHHGSRLMAKKIFRSRSKSQTRPAHTPCNWTPQGSCVWNNVSGRQVVLNDTNLLHLSDIERKLLQKVAIAKLQALNLGVNVKVPTENVAAVTKPKRRPYLLKRKALTTGIFDTSRKDAEKEKDNSGGLVFGIPLTQCVENDRLSRTASSTSPFRSRGDLPGSGEEPATIGRHGSRASFSSLIEAPRGDDSGSCESLMSRDRIVGSVPGLLDTLSCGSTADITGGGLDDESSVPNILHECIRYLEQNGLHTLGIFRVSTSKKRIRQLREDFDCGKETTLDNELCPHDVATLLKEYLRDLPDPLLCRDLYHAFVQTQRIRNRRLQFEALQHLIQLLPPANRDTLFALLSFLANVAKHSEDSKNDTGESLTGNKMDSNNLATVFAPNILHCIKPGSKEMTVDRPEDRIDIINVVRTLIDHYKQLYSVSAELLDEVYVHMMDTNPEFLDQLLNKRDAVGGADESVEELDSESNSAPWTPTMPNPETSIENILAQTDADGRTTPSSEPKKVYSREECLHEAAATGGPNIGMRVRYKDRIREKSTRRKREESASRKRKEDELMQSGAGMTSAMALITRLRGQKEDEYNQYSKNRSSSLESNSSTHTDSDLTRALRMTDDLQERRKSSPYVLNNNGVITASLTIPVQTQNQSLSYNVDDDIPYIEDTENGRQQLTIGVVRTPQAPPRRRQHSTGSDSSVSSNIQQVTGSISLVQGYDSAVGSSATYSSPIQNTPSSMSSSIGDAGVFSSPPSWASTPPTSPESTQTSVNYIPDDIVNKVSARKSSNSGRNTPVLQKVTFSSTREVQQVKQNKDNQRLYQKEVSFQKQAELSRSATFEREPKFSTSISNIGNAVLRSKTADFERIMKSEAKASKQPSTTANSSDREKKKYTKRRYTDSRHQTRHIPDSDALDSAGQKQEQQQTTSQAGQQVYKRRELISSVPSK